MQLTNDQLRRIYFERKPPYSEEALLKAKNEEYKVEYSIQREYTEIKTVKESSSMQETKNEDKNPLKKEELLFKVSNILKKVPDFEYMTEKDKTLVIADLLNGKYDSDLF